MPGQSQHERQRMLCHGYRVRPRRVHHHNSARGGELDIDVVNTDASAANYSEIWRALEQVPVGLHGRTHDQCRRIAKVLIRRPRVFLWADYFPAWGSAQELFAGGRDFFRDDDFHGELIYAVTSSAPEVSLAYSR